MSRALGVLFGSSSPPPSMPRWSMGGRLAYCSSSRSRQPTRSRCGRSFSRTPRAARRGFHKPVHFVSFQHPWYHANFGSPAGVHHAPSPSRKRALCSPVQPRRRRAAPEAARRLGDATMSSPPCWNTAHAKSREKCYVHFKTASRRASPSPLTRPKELAVRRRGFRTARAPRTGTASWSDLVPPTDEMRSLLAHSPWGRGRRRWSGDRQKPAKPAPI